MRNSSKELTVPTIFRLTLLELHYLFRSRIAAILLAIFAITGVGSATGLASIANARLRRFAETMNTSLEAGITLEESLAEPLNITQVGQNGVYMDNPLRYDYEDTQATLSSLQPLGFSINALQFISFIMIPIAAFILALVLVTRDYKLRTLKVRSSRASFTGIRCSQLAATICVLLISAAAAMLAAVIAGIFASGTVESNSLVPFAEGVGSTTGYELCRTLVILTGIALFFGICGWGIGLIIRQALIPAIAFIIWDLVCPLLGPFDPRSLWQGIAQTMLAFHGSFEMVPVAPVPSILGLASLCGMAGVFAIGGFVVSNRVSRYT